MATKSKSKETKTDTDGMDRSKMLDLTMQSIEKQYGKGSIMRLGDKPVEGLRSIPTGALSLDVALGVGGIPKGRIIEIYGPESSGKTTLTLSVVAEAQKQGGIAAFIDAEHALDPEYAAKLGVDTSSLLISQPDTGEQALEICEQLVRSGAIDVVVIDSVAALVPKSEIEGDMGQAQVGLQARLMSQALRKLTAIVSKTDTSIIFINQLRMKIGVMYGNPETTTGGNALKFYSSVRMDIRRKETLKRDGEDYGNRVMVRIKKNKVAPPFRSAEFDIIFGEGISSEGCLLDVAVDMDVVDKAGTWFSYKDLRLGQGRDKSRDYLLENPQIREEIESEVRQKLAEKSGKAAPAEETAKDEAPADAE